MKVPFGINGDEGAIGYNSALISKTLRDENGRFLPVFVLSNSKTDWHQPVTIYLSALAFKIFGPSFLLFRLVSVFLAVLSTFLLGFLLIKLFNLKLAIFGSILFITTPLILIHAHLGMENIAPLPFVLIWLISLYFYTKKPSFKLLIFSGISLGISFYSYKGMRLIVPVWVILTIGYILLNSILNNRKKIKKVFFDSLVFILSISPFLVVTPFLEQKYAGAVFDKKSPTLNSYTEFFYGYMANLDLSFLFIQGDTTATHSVFKYGAFLLSTLPFFLLGLYKALKQRGFILFVLIVFLLTPLLFGFVSSVFRASRLLVMVPLFVIICSLGIKTLWELNSKRMKVLFFILIMFFVLNTGDFLHHYWYKYSDFYKIRQAFTNTSNDAYIALAKESKKLNSEAYIQQDTYDADKEAAKFFELAYFGIEIKKRQEDEKLPKGSLLLTSKNAQPGMKKLNINLPAHYILEAD